MTLEALKQYRAWRMTLQSLRTELAQRQREFLQMESTGAVAEGSEQARRLRGLADEMAAHYLAHEARIREAERWVAALPGDREAIFRLRYLEGLSWAQVARQTGYSEKQVFWIQRKTMEEEARRAAEQTA